MDVPRPPAIAGTLFLALFASFAGAQTSDEEFVVHPFYIYPSDQPPHPEYLQAVEAIMLEIQAWYLGQVGATVRLAPVQVIQGPRYELLRCGQAPPAICLSDPARTDGIWHQAATLMTRPGPRRIQAAFVQGGGGFAGGLLLDDLSAQMVVGDWVLEPLSGIREPATYHCAHATWQCVPQTARGTVAHELGHAFGLHHPLPSDFDGTIMGWHGSYPENGLLDYEIAYLAETSFFARGTWSAAAPRLHPLAIPDVAQAGQVLSLFGSQLSGVTGVWFTGRTVRFQFPIAVTDSEVLVRVPEDATSGFVQVEIDRLSHPVALLVEPAPPGPRPVVELLALSDGSIVEPGFNTFSCRGSSARGLSWIEIAFRGEHRHRCSFAGATAAQCSFVNFYVGPDLAGSTVPVSCTAADGDGVVSDPALAMVVVGSPDRVAPRIEAVAPPDGSVLGAGQHHRFTCTASDDQELRSIEVLFNQEHRRTCSLAGPGRADCVLDAFYIGQDLGGRTVPLRCTARDAAGNESYREHRIVIRSADTAPPVPRFIRPHNGTILAPGHHDFACTATDDRDLASLEIVFNNEHRQRCSFGAGTYGTCTFSRFYVGADLMGRQIPMRCEALDRSGNRSTQHITVRIGQQDSLRPWVGMRYPFSGSVLYPGFNNFLCEARDDQALRSIEIEFNGEHRRRCDVAGGTYGLCVFSNFYVGGDLRGRTLPMRCTAYDRAGNGSVHAILVRIE